MPADSRVDLATWRSLADASLPVGREKTLPPPGKVRIKIDIYARRLTVYSDETPYKVYPVAVGKPETPTPLGYFRIVSKEWWGEGFGTRWMQLDTKFGKYGIHGTNKPWSIGSFASHGCIRMHNRHVEELFEWVKVGTPVYITKGPWGELGGRPLLKRGGLKGSPVMVVQRRLKQLGYYDIGVDGIYGFGTQQAVKKFQEDHGLNPTGVVDTATWDALGLFYFE
ncbi:MAG: L,D-transpeptidase family protein [Firmicutes bacterium]|nr:L,D-transpeptidase family protein [Bacillota bacterium]